MSTIGKPTTGGEASDIKRLKELEHENSMLQRLYTDLSFGEYGIEGCNRKKSSNACRTVSGRRSLGAGSHSELQYPHLSVVRIHLV